MGPKLKKNKTEHINLDEFYLFKLQILSTSADTAFITCAFPRQE